MLKVHERFARLEKKFPRSLYEQARFFRLQGDAKGSLPTGWNKPLNQQKLRDVIITTEGHMYPIGFDVTGHGVGSDYMFLDFDHVLNAETGAFVNPAAQEYYNTICEHFANIYCEKSISGTGLHMFLLPTAGKFPSIAASENRGTLWFDHEKNIKLEVFYATGGRYCLITADYFGCEIKYVQGEVIYPVIPSGEAVDSFIEKELLPRINVDSYSETRKAEDKERARAMLAFIPVSAVTYQDWLAVGMILKNNGNTLEDWLSWSKPDLRYKEGECYSKWQGFKGSGLTIATLHALAKIYGYSEASRPAELDLTNEKRQIVFHGIEGISDLANADRLAYLFGNEFRYVADIDSWANYSGGVWEINCKNTALNPIVSKAARILKANATTESEKRIAACFSNHRKYSPAVTTLKGITEITIKLSDLDKHKNLLNVENGVVDLETSKLYQHSPELLLTQKCSAEYRENYTSETVDNFFCSILPDEDTRFGLFRFLGYSLTAECSSEKFLFIDGSGGNGKGTLTKVLLELFNNYACAFPIGAILLSGASTDANAATPAFNILEHKRLAISEEIPQGAKLNSATVKQLTGGDRIYIRRLHQEAGCISDPTHKMIFTGNYLPEIGDVHDPGILRRLLRIQFTQDFTQSPDETLKRRLLTKEARAGLLSLLVSNARNWYKYGLFISSNMKQAVRAYTESQDFIAEFISEHCVVSNGASIPRKDLLSKLKEEYPQEVRSLSDRALTAMLEKQEGVSYRIGGKNHSGQFYGIGFREG